MKRALLIVSLSALAVLAGCSAHSTATSPVSPAQASSALASAQASADAWMATPQGKHALDHAAGVITRCGAQTDTVKGLVWTAPPLKASAQVTPHLHFVKYSVAFVTCVKTAYKGLGHKIGACLQAAGLTYSAHVIRDEATILLGCAAKSSLAKS